jgi:hypothetical protein
MIFLFVFLLAGLCLFIQSFFIPVQAFAWSSLLTAGDFTGIQTDVSTAVAGIISIAIIILGASLLLGALRR